MTSDTVVHENPVWRARANFIIVAKIDPTPTNTQWRWEQLWAQQVAENRFIICCIPFFVYDLALGDEVQTISSEGRQYLVQQVISPSGHYTFRVWFCDPQARDKVPCELAHLGCLMEWRWASSNLLAVDVIGSQAQAVADLLLHREQLGHLVYETGLMKAR